MSRKGKLSVSLKGPDAEMIVRDLIAAGRVPEGAPESLEVGFEDKTPTANWLTANLATAKNLRVFFEDDSSLSFERGGLVKFQRTGIEFHDPTTLFELGKLPFEVASIGTVYTEWFDPALGWDSPGFSDGHGSLGWACGFKGAGHDRLV